MTDLEVIDTFDGPYRFLSNFYAHPVTIYCVIEHRWITYPTAEHAFNASKTNNPEEAAKVIAAPTPGEAKRIGRQVTLRNGWDERARYWAMETVLRHKFPEEGGPLVDRLIDTGFAKLIEGNTWHDTHWGVCRCTKPWCIGKRRGSTPSNVLGIMLMNLRDIHTGWRDRDLPLWDPKSDTTEEHP